MQSSCVAGVVQYDVVEGGLEVNTTRVFQGLMKLAESGCHLAMLPEMWSAGFDYACLGEMADRTPELMDRICAFAGRERMVICGSLPERVEQGIANTLFVANADGSLAGRYQKMHLFAAGGEGEHFVAGESAVVVDSSVGRLGLMICYDLRFPELARSLVVAGAEMLLVSAQWPDVRRAHWNALLMARAIENQCYVVGANRVGRSGALQFSGGSQIVSPMGTLLSEAGSADGEILAECHEEELIRFRSQIPCLEERRPMCYS